MPHSREVLERCPRPSLAKKREVTTISQIAGTLEEAIVVDTQCSKGFVELCKGVDMHREMQARCPRSPS